MICKNCKNVMEQDAEEDTYERWVCKESNDSGGCETRFVKTYDEEKKEWSEHWEDGKDGF